MRALWIIALLSSGCIKSSDFHCDSNADCGSTGRCELATGGFCSFPDSSCTVSGYKYGDNSGPNSNKCVGEEQMMKDAPDGTEMTGGEPLPTGCPATGYAALPNSGPRMHMYKVFATGQSWANAKSTCSGEGTWLAFPDGANVTDARAELAALRVAIGDGGWVGVEDIVQKGTWKNSLNLNASAVTQMLLATPAGSGPDRCENIISATQIDDANCGGAKKFVCECMP